jgi:hypothetical protein
MILIGLPLTFFLLGPREYGALAAGSTGLAVKMVFTQFLSVNIQLWVNAKYLKQSPRAFLVHQAGVLLMFSVAAWGCSHLVSSLLPASNFMVQFLLSGILYSVAILGLVLVFPWTGALQKSEISQLLVQLKDLRKSR